MVLVHSARCLEYSVFGHVETPARVASTVARLRRERHEWLEPVGCQLPDLLRVHDEPMVRSVQAGNFHDPRRSSSASAA
jgi:acetoin utilization deacetylase AcuC-like enzyme